MHHIKHEHYHDGIIGNCISVPRHEYRVGSRNDILNSGVKCIRFEQIGNVDFYTVYWKIESYNKVIDNHR